tara:strand:- start:586 stop:1347 length:762 start_codon:yes stop_codon:yes gene_type:complete
MRLFNNKKIEFLLKKLLNFSEALNLERRAKRYLKKNTEREIRILNLLIDESKAAIDIGVYRGVYSYFLTKFSSFVYAFEANPLLHSKLNSSFKNNKNIKIENLAVSSGRGFTSLRIPIRDIEADYDDDQKYKLGIATIHSGNQLEDESFETLDKIETISLDEYNFEHPIGFIKIDVEGHELEILKGAKNLLETNKPNMIIEIEERHSGVPREEIISYVKNIGYEVFYVNEKFQVMPVTNLDNVSNHNFLFKPL